jgi:hypothetical protein
VSDARKWKETKKLTTITMTRARAAVSKFVLNTNTVSFPMMEFVLDQMISPRYAEGLSDLRRSDVLHIFRPITTKKPYHRDRDAAIQNRRDCAMCEACGSVCFELRFPFERGRCAEERMLSTEARR